MYTEDYSFERMTELQTKTICLHIIQLRGVGGINLKQIEHYPQDDFCGTSLHPRCLHS